MTCTPSWAARVDAALVGEHEGALYAEVRRHLDACAACAAVWNETAQRLAAIEGRPGRLPEAVEAAVLGRVFDALDAEEGTQAVVAPVVRPTFGRVRGVVGLVAVALAAGAAVFVGTTPGLESPESAASVGFQPRGASTTGAGLQAFCVAPTPEREGAQVLGAANSGLAEPVRCEKGARLQFAYSTPSVDAAEAAATPRTLSLFATGPNGEFVWYWPRAEAPFELVGGARSVPLPGSFEVSVLHRPGRWRVTGVFAAEAVERAFLEGLARSGGEARVAAWASEQGGSVQGAGLWLEVEGGDASPGGIP